MFLETYNQPWDFELLDTGNGYRLEKWGGVILARPDPQIIWTKSLPDSEWKKAWAIFGNRGTHADSVRGSNAESTNGKWDIKKALPAPWTITWNNISFLLKLSPFKHTGLFAEQAAQWDFMIKKLENSKIKKLKILNLFAYTGGATMVLAKHGCQVTHVDASKPSLNWANENYKVNNLLKENVRWILDDAIKFVKRELKRGVRYDGIIMDPPAFGHGPTGKTWKFNDDLPGLLSDCVQLLSPQAKFLIINGYATNSSALALNNLLDDATKKINGKIEFGELCLQQSSGRMISTGIFARWQGI
jgi:23S rRNA (cytosine1962-C5)-methyltransferase